jgi:hypothetical protein
MAMWRWPPLSEVPPAIWMSYQFGPPNCLIVVRTIQACRIDKPVTVLDIEKVAGIHATRLDVIAGPKTKE